jgi:hypothetical protein
MHELASWERRLTYGSEMMCDNSIFLKCETLLR